MNENISNVRRLPAKGSKHRTLGDYAYEELLRLIIRGDFPESRKMPSETNLANAIGVSRPISVYVETHGTGSVDEDRLAHVLQQLVDLSPRGMREHLGLNKPIYARTSAYGHFGRPPEPDGGFSWEKTDLVDQLRSEFGAR